MVTETNSSLPSMISQLNKVEIRVDDGEKLTVWDSKTEGIPIVFAHGFPQTHLCWSGVLDALRPLGDRYRFICYDLRGFGESSKSGEASWQRFFQDHLNIVTALGLPKYHFVGHDWGGATALHVARFHPEQLRSAIILNTNYWKTDLKGMWHLFFLNLPIVTRLAFSLAPQVVFRSFLVKTFRDPNRVPNNVSKAYLEMFTDKQTVDFWIRLYRNMAKSLVRQSSPAQLKRLLKTSYLKTPSVSPQAFKIPITLIWGADDTFNPLWIAKDMLERLTRAGSQANLETVPDSGHFVSEEQPQIVSRHISNHVTRLDTT